MAFTTSRTLTRQLCRPTCRHPWDTTSLLSHVPPVSKLYAPHSATTTGMASLSLVGRAFNDSLFPNQGHSRIRLKSSLREESGSDYGNKPVQNNWRKNTGKNRNDARRVTSWMQKNGQGGGGDDASSKHFKNDFQGTRVFVQGLPKDATWKDLKDHFKIAGDVVFASVSIDSRTKESKQCGIVQFETTDMARNAIRSMRNHPMNGEKLYVREDVQESSVRRTDSEVGELGRRASNQRAMGAIKWEWKCANEEDEKMNISEGDIDKVKTLIYERDMVRMRKEYDRSDAIRQNLKDDFGVHLDDRDKMWWVNTEGGVPGMVSDTKGEGRWGKQKPWKQIPTTVENDALVDSDLVDSLLKKRDKARGVKDFETADQLLEKVHSAPEGKVGLRIHDESRTWRIWTERPPPRFDDKDGDENLSANEICFNLVRENEPDKVEEVDALLKKFPGREWTILRKLKQKYRSD